MNWVQSSTLITVSPARSLIVAFSLLADLALSRLSASFTITTNFSVCPEGLLLIIFHHLGRIFCRSFLSSALCSANFLARFYQRIVAINNKDINKLIYFENQFIMHYTSTNVELDY
jgi:hypothetical protein